MLSIRLNMRTMRLIKQKNPTGCGVACVAMIAGVEYLDSKTVFCKLLDRNKDKRKSLRTYSEDLKSLLFEFGIESEIKETTSWRGLSGVSIVAVNWEGIKFHWVIVIKDKNRFIVIDPETSEVYQGAAWKDIKGGYKLKTGKSEYVSIPITVDTISI